MERIEVNALQLKNFDVIVGKLVYSSLTHRHEVIEQKPRVVRDHRVEDRKVPGVLGTVRTAIFFLHCDFDATLEVKATSSTRYIVERSS